MLDSTMKEIGYDAKKMPLGKLGDSTFNTVQINNLLKTIINDKI